jgi:hypothetical protein
MNPRRFEVAFRIAILSPFIIYVSACQQRTFNSENRSVTEWRDESDNNFDNVALLSSDGDKLMHTLLNENAKTSELCVEELNSAIGEKTDQGAYKSFQLSLKKPKVKERYKIVLSTRAPFCLFGRNKNSDFPDALKGVWWMDGNPMPDSLVSFANADWDPIAKEVTIKVFGSNNWSFHASPVVNELSEKLHVQNLPRGSGLLLHGFTNSMQVTYKFAWTDFDTSNTVNIIPHFTKLKIGLKSKNIADFKFVETADESEFRRLIQENNEDASADILIRRSTILGRSMKDYKFKRIIDKDGNILKDNYMNYLFAMKKSKLVYQAIYR